MESSPVPAPDAHVDPVAASDNPDRQPLRSPDDVTPEMRENLRDIAHKAKAIHHKGSAKLDYKNFFNDTDVKRLLERVFARGWVTGGVHHLQLKDYVQPNMHNHAYSATVSDKSVIESLSSTTAPKASFQVFVSCEELRQAPGVATFVYHDADYNILPDAVQRSIDFLWVDDLEKARGMALLHHDKIELSRGWHNNQRAAVYLARNRLTHWANGNDAESRPEGENGDLLVDYNLMRYLACTSESAMALCREPKIRSFWHH